MVCYYEGQNKMTVKEDSPLPMVEETLGPLPETVMFSKFDLVGASHQLRIRKEDMHRGAFCTRFGSFEWLVFCYKLSNALAAFTQFTADIFKDPNGDYLTFYLDDVIIYSRSIERHLTHLRTFLEL